MDCAAPQRLKLVIVFLLVSTNIVCLHGNPITGMNHSLRCVTDYLHTINCSLSIAPSQSSNCSYKLTFIHTFEKVGFDCMLTNTDGDYFCSAKKTPDTVYSTFDGSDSYVISLCHHQNDGSEICEVLDDEFEPLINIKPNAPCCLTVSHNASQRHFTWISTYEIYDLHIALVSELQYQLHYYKRDNQNVLSHYIEATSLNYSVDDHNFAPDTEYAARVRTSPNQVSYKGQWSDWSSEVYWETQSAVNDLPFVFGLGKVIILLVMVPIVLLFCYAPVKKWRQSAFIPTPAPYFHTLYSDFQGDFKSWVVTQEHTADMLKAEETLQIDTLTKCAVVEEEECQPQFHHQFMEGSTYSNITDPGCDPSLLGGIPYAVITMAPLSSTGSTQPREPC
ncbi:interleukin-21 receptor [Cottoperca gobio]|uniref:Interleukin-21 receptor n=1 Tax=Cottoperca gobio TaxID=56716 RepID=A0A6J2RNR3_COTGO|nr:interleukin-21 receptor-like [Cottoperca gobio]